MRNFLLAVITATLLVACGDHHTNPDPCADVTCSHGTCQNGSCVCEQDWYGTECDKHFDPAEIGTSYQDFCSSDSGRLEISGVTGDASYLNGYYVDIPVGAVDRCVWFILAPAWGENLPLPDTGTIVESAHGIVITAIDKEQPFLADGTDFNTVQLLKEVTIFFNQHRAKVLLYSESDRAFTFLRTDFVPEGTLGQTIHLSEFYLDFGNPDVEATAQHLGNREVEIDFTWTLDEGSPLPYFLQFSADGDGTPLTLEPVDSGGLKYRTTLAGGQHTIIATVTNPYGGTGSKQIDLTVDLCSGVTCEPWQTCREIDGVCIGSDPCDLNPCVHGTCDNTTGSAVCICNGGWLGTLCDQQDLCYEVTCSDNGVCKPADGTCQCNAGYDGATCNACASGYMGYPTCVDDLCYNVDCHGHGSCNQADGTCSCDTGFDPTTNCGSCAAGYYDYPTCHVNHAPVISNLQASPNPASQYSPTTITFSLADSDSDTISWTITLTAEAGYDGWLSTSNGTCDRWDHRYGTVNGSGGVTVTFNTGYSIHTIVNVSANDGRGGTDMKDTAIDVQ